MRWTECDTPEAEPFNGNVIKQKWRWLTLLRHSCTFSAWDRCTVEVRRIDSEEET